MVELFHEAGARLSSPLLFPGRELSKQEDPPPSTIWLARKRISEDTPVVLRKPDHHNHMASKVYAWNV